MTLWTFRLEAARQVALVVAAAVVEADVQAEETAVSGPAAAEAQDEIGTLTMAEMVDSEEAPVLPEGSVDGKAKAAVRIQTVGPESAERVKRTLEAALALGRNMLEQQGRKTSQIQDARLRNTMQAAFEVLHQRH